MPPNSLRLEVIAEVLAHQAVSYSTFSWLL